MIFLAVILLLVVGFGVGLALLGVLGNLAPLDWLMLLGISSVAMLTAVVIYRGTLHRWVQGGKHPLSLRIVAFIAAALLWVAACQALLWSDIARAPIWNGDPGSAFLGALVYTTLLVALLAVGLAAPQRFR
jgi:UDP-N-acetylmuramyl pentapeptide phosphotransferase/UDP-N-acetylglucosamine-1-phosphate transferase